MQYELGSKGVRNAPLPAAGRHGAGYYLALGAAGLLMWAGVPTTAALALGGPVAATFGALWRKIHG